MTEGGPERPHWVLDLDQLAGWVVREPNPPNDEDWRLTKNGA